MTADIAEYYGTLYTHSIAWALHGKDFVKTGNSRHDNSLLGNRLDLAVRNGQLQQTNGIPIGPDTSFVLGEIILCAVDDALEEIGRPLSYFRYYDDYEVTFERLSDAEEFLAGMHTVLRTFNLQLNVPKTRIVELPMGLDSAWRDPIRRYSFGLTETKRAKELIGYFDLVFREKAAHPTEPVVSYAISRLDSVRLTANSWRVAEALLLQALSAEPDSVQHIANAFAKAYARGVPLGTDAIGQAVGLLLRRHCPQGHGFEVAWSLWMLLSFGIAVEDDAALTALSRMNDSVVALLALDCRDRGLLPGLDISHWAQFMTATELYREHWLLSYEARARGWLPSADKRDHVANDNAYSFLKKSGVNFYIRVRAPTKASVKRVPRWRGGYGDTPTISELPLEDSDSSDDSEVDEDLPF